MPFSSGEQAAISNSQHPVERFVNAVLMAQLISMTCRWHRLLR